MPARKINSEIISGFCLTYSQSSAYDGGTEEKNSSSTEGKKMSPIQAAQAMITGMLFVLGSTAAALAWGLSTRAVTSLSADAAPVVAIIAAGAFLLIPAARYIMKKALA